MAMVVCEPCVGCKSADCVEVCPTECIYSDERQYYIDPGDCIDCAACVSVCPAGAIFHEGDVPPPWAGYVALNAERAAALRAAAAGRLL